MGRAPCCDKANVKKGPWSPEEDSKLKDYIEKNGTGGNWIALPQKVGLRRCGKSCRLRWLNYLRPNIKHGEFSEEEDRVICSLYATIGSRWSIIAAQLPGRTDNDIKNYWNTKLKKKLMAFAAAAAAAASSSTTTAFNTAAAAAASTAFHHRSSTTANKPLPPPSSIYSSTSSQMTSLYDNYNYTPNPNNPKQLPLMVHDNQQQPLISSHHQVTNDTTASSTTATSCCLETCLPQQQQYYQPLIMFGGSDHQQQTSCSSTNSDNNGGGGGGGISCGNKQARADMGISYHHNFSNSSNIPNNGFDEQLGDQNNKQQRGGFMLNGYDEINNDNVFLSHQFDDHHSNVINSSTHQLMADCYANVIDKQQQLSMNMNDLSLINIGGGNQQVINSKITSQEKDQMMMMYYFNSNYC